MNCSMMSTSVNTDVKQQLSMFVPGWVTVSALGQVWVKSDLKLVFCHQTFINSSALIVSVMALRLVHVERNTFLASFLLKKYLSQKLLVYLCSNFPCTLTCIYILQQTHFVNIYHSIY